jgi:hypothetical protein
MDSEIAEPHLTKLLSANLKVKIMNTEMKQFLCKLIPRRPTFAQDMTEVERKIMQEHIGFTGSCDRIMLTVSKRVVAFVTLSVWFFPKVFIFQITSSLTLIALQWVIANKLKHIQNLN